MARITLVDEESPEIAPLAREIKAGRRGSLLKVYGTLLHSPPLAKAWFAYLNAVRWETGLSGRLREILIIRVGFLNGSAYVLKQHVPALAAQEGLGADECAALASERVDGSFSSGERFAIAYADEMTRRIEVSDTAFEAMRGAYSERQIVEITVLIGAYNMHTRVLRALDVDLET